MLFTQPLKPMPSAAEHPGTVNATPSEATLPVTVPVTPLGATSETSTVSAAPSVTVPMTSPSIIIPTSPSLITIDPLELLSESRKMEAKNIEKKIVQSLKKKKYYRCKVCKNLIMGPDAEQMYAEHIKKCFKSNIFECSICFKKFTHNRGLKTHLRNTHLVFD